MNNRVPTTAVIRHISKFILHPTIACSWWQANPISSPKAQVVRNWLRERKIDCIIVGDTELEWQVIDRLAQWYSGSEVDGDELYGMAGNVVEQLELLCLNPNVEVEKFEEFVAVGLLWGATYDLRLYDAVAAVVAVLRGVPLVVDDGYLHRQLREVQKSRPTLEVIALADFVN